MTTPPILSVSATTATPKAKEVAPGSKLDKDAFLKLLVAQLKYQNPAAPTDPTAMMAQTAQFTMVESLQELSKTQTDAGAWQRVVAGQGMIGRQVTAPDPTLVPDGEPARPDITGVVTGLTITADGPQLQLADGRTVAVNTVLNVATAPPPGAPATPPAQTP